MIGKNISPILIEIENQLLLFEAEIALKPEYTNDGFRAGVKIFMSVMLDKMWELQVDENIPFDIRADMADKLGNEIRHLIKKYTNIDTHELYK
jgi:hypothetical protein